MLFRLALVSSFAACSMLLVPALSAQQDHPISAGLSPDVQTHAAPAQAVPPANVVPSPNLLGIAHIALRVHSLPDSVAFYEKLGFVKAFELSRNGAVYEAFIKINDHQFIELYPTDAKNPQVGFLHVCFYGDNLYAVHDYYVQHGLNPISVRTAGAGNLLFTVPGPMTPQGPQNMEYTQYMPGSLHSRDFGKDLGPDRIATQMLSVTIAAEDPAAARAFYLDKVGFLPRGNTGSLAMPGSHGESIDIVPAASLGFRARVALGRAVSDAELKRRDIPMQKGANATLLTDPDGNELLLVDPASTPVR